MSSPDGQEETSNYLKPIINAVTKSESVSRNQVGLMRQENCHKSQQNKGNDDRENS